MAYTLSYQMYKCEHGLSAAEQRAADVRAGEAAAALRDLRLRLGRSIRLRNLTHLTHRARPARKAADAVTAPARVLSSVR
jgi:hypothetical protein